MDDQPRPRTVEYGPDAPLRLAELRRVTPAHPTQWWGVTEHRAPVYVRYRWGRLSVDVGPDEDWNGKPRDDLPWRWRAPDDGTERGEMTDAELRRRLPWWIEVPHGFGDEP